MRGIVLSYRRDDAAASAHAIYERLRDAYPAARVFLDVYGIDTGVDYRRRFREALEHCDVMIALVGARWHGPRDGASPRIDEADDPVRLEIEEAMHMEKPILPVLLDGAAMPNARDLPESIREFAFLNGTLIAQRDGIVPIAEFIDRIFAQNVRQAVFEAPHNLPERLTQFVGRKNELGEVTNLIERRHRIVTICGPGGIGKTRFALELALQQLGEWPDGVWFVPLASVHRPDLIVQTAADALSVREVPGEPLADTLLRFAANKQMLLVFDNAEHLHEATASFVTQLLQRSRRSLIVVTSRQPLHVEGERVYRLDSIDEQASLLLFQQRAADASASTQTFDENDLRFICRRLEGIPLAIELAAARTAILTLSDIRTHLERELSFLASPSATAGRHRTLRATIAWSYEMLDRPERAVLAAAAAFTGSFPIHAWSALIDRGDGALESMQSLVDKSLIVAQRNSTSSRFRMLDAIKEFVHESMTPEPRIALQESHFRYFAALAIRGREALSGKVLPEWIDAIDVDIANVRAALEYGTARDMLEIAEPLTGLYRYWIAKRTIAEGQQWLERFIRATPEGPVTPQILWRLSRLRFLRGDWQKARTEVAEAIALSERSNQHEVLLEAIHASALIELSLDNRVPAQRLFERIAQSAGGRLALIAVANLVTLHLNGGNLGEADRLLREFENRSSQFGDGDLIARGNALRGMLFYASGSWREAAIHFSSAADPSIGSRSGSLRIEAQASSAAAYLRLHELPVAEALLHEALGSALAADDAVSAVPCLEVAAQYFDAAGRSQEAVTALAAARKIRDQYNFRFCSTPGANAFAPSLPGTELQSGESWKTVAGALLERSPVHATR